MTKDKIIDETIYIPVEEVKESTHHAHITGELNSIILLKKSSKSDYLSSLITEADLTEFLIECMIENYTEEETAKALFKHLNK